MPRPDEHAKDFRDLVQFMEVNDVQKYSGPKDYTQCQMLIKTWEVRGLINGRRRTFVDGDMLYIVRIR